MTLHLSYRTRRHLAERLTHLPLGEAHYSYTNVYDKVAAMLRASGVLFRELPMPEIYPGHLVPDIFAPFGGRVMHIAFKPFEELRLLKGAFNIAHVAWEHDKLPSSRGRPADDPFVRSSFNDYVQVLSLFDEIWVGSEFARDVFVRHGLTHTYVVPAPIAVGGVHLQNIRPIPPEADEPKMEFIRAEAGILHRFRRERTRLPARAWLSGEVAATRRRGGRVFVSVINPGDQRKNVIASLLGFQKHWYATGRKDLLVMKLLVDGKQKFLWDAAIHIRTRFEAAGYEMETLDCPGILLSAGQLTSAEMGWLYSVADFYLCTSFAEGQNLPILEGMAAGAVPVSPHVTAMTDYLTVENSFRIATVRTPMTYDLARHYGLHDVQWHHASPEAVAEALRAACRPGHDLAPMRRAAHEMIVSSYSPSVILRQMNERLDAVPRLQVVRSREATRQTVTA